MGHRALVAYEVRPDEFDVHYSHNGAIKLQLVHAITADQPYADGAVDAEPVDDDHRRASLETIKNDLLDYGRHEALFLVNDEFEVTAWGVEEYRFSRHYGTDTRQPQTARQYESEQETPPDTEPRARGVCLPVRWYDGEPVSLSLDRGRVQGYVESAADLVEREILPDAEAAVEFVHEKVRSRFMGSVGPASSYDEPMLSSEDSVPASYDVDKHRLSDLMTDGGQPTDEAGGQQSLGDY